MRVVSKTTVLKTPYTVALSPRQARFAETEAKRLQISVPEVMRQLVDREIARFERAQPEKLALRA